MKRTIERFERRLDLIRQSLDIPGMSVAVVHKQAVVLALGFGVVDVATGDPPRSAFVTAFLDAFGS